MPQNYVPSIKVGTKAQIIAPEYPGRTFGATVEASAQSVDAASGTTRMLLVVDNRQGRADDRRVRQCAPRTAEPRDRDQRAGERVDFRSERACASRPSGRTTASCSRQVTISRDLGREVEIATGLTVEDRIIESPPDGIGSGDLVRIADKPKQAGAETPQQKRGKL